MHSHLTFLLIASPSSFPGLSPIMAEESLETDGPRSAMPAELPHPHSKYTQWKFKLFRVKSIEKAPMSSEKEAMSGITKPNLGTAPNVLLDNGTTTGAVIRLCLSGESKETAQPPHQSMDMKLEEIDNHIKHLR